LAAAGLASQLQELLGRLGVEAGSVFGVGRPNLFSRIAFARHTLKNGPLPFGRQGMPEAPETVRAQPQAARSRVNCLISQFRTAVFSRSFWPVQCRCHGYKTEMTMSISGSNARDKQPSSFS
jgi:hypothetical protein